MSQEAYTQRIMPLLLPFSIFLMNPRICLFKNFKKIRTKMPMKAFDPSLAVIAYLFWFR